jgi:hypothetical protein
LQLVLNSLAKPGSFIHQRIPHGLKTRVTIGMQKNRERSAIFESAAKKRSVWV